MEKISFNIADFTGPLDLLLHLLQKNKMEIQNIEIASITQQYMNYIESANVIELSYMSEFIVMASTLLFIKSNMLLPKHENKKNEENDPKAELITRLLEYKKVKYIASELDKKQGKKISYYFRNKEIPNEIVALPTTGEILAKTSINDLILTYKEVLRYNKLLKIQREKEIDAEILKKEIYTIEKKSKEIVNLLHKNNKLSFFSLCQEDISKSEFVTTFMSVLELVHKNIITTAQEDLFNDINIELIDESSSN
ncbi:hypothetical protein AN641_05180 [Candidatus Epulonipiscioides gigas]|nr:hypothetical protein AN641_05180 [Epulopiscium sp. SCG-C07WGA-EpuloA2]